MDTQKPVLTRRVYNNIRIPVLNFKKINQIYIDPMLSDDDEDTQEEEN